MSGVLRADELAPAQGLLRGERVSSEAFLDLSLDAAELIG
jgi:hypothetical protein